MESKNQIFKNGSKTFFYSSFFFPKKVKEEVSILYAFVRVADDFVDQVPALKEEFFHFKNLYYQALVGNASGDNIIDDFVALQKKYDFKNEWVDAFLLAMESDLGVQKLKTIEESTKYMYGSASVVGFMMCKILGIKEEAYAYADKLGQAFQYINFIRDIDEDNALNRQYLPQQNLEKYNLDSLRENYISQNQENFIKFLRVELEYFYELIDEAKKGFGFIPRRYRIPIEIATNLYLYTAKIIYKNPLIVYEKKVKPKISRIFIEALKVILKK